MVKRIVLFDKFYNISNISKQKQLIGRYLKYIKQFSQSFTHTNIRIKKLRKFDKRIEVEITGPEEVFVYNILKKEVGSVVNFNDINPNNILKGNLVDVGKIGFGLFVDCAILNPKTDVLVNLHMLREQLCNGEEKSIKYIIKKYDFIDNYPVFIKIKSINKESHQIEGEFDDTTMKFYKKLIDEKLEAILLSGETKGQLKKALIRKGHLKDIISIERYGFLENIVILKEGTNAVGIISEIGKYLRSCKLSVINPKRFETYFN